MIGIIGIIIFLVLLFMGMNIGLAMLLVGFVGFMVLRNYNAALALVRTQPVDTASKYSYIPAPFSIAVTVSALVEDASASGMPLPLISERSSFTPFFIGTPFLSVYPWNHADACAASDTQSTPLPRCSFTIFMVVSEFVPVHFKNISRISPR